MKRLLYLLLSLSLLSGCGSDSDKANDEPDEPEISVNVMLELSRDELAFEAAGGEKTFTVSCNWNWTIENGSGWCRTDFNNGTGNLTVTVTVDEYSGMEDRNTNLTVKAGDKTAVLTVTQKNKGIVVITEVFDPAFAGLLQRKRYIPDSTHITIADVKNIEELYVSGREKDYKSGKGLTSLKGIEYFESLTILDCGYNQLTSLDVSQNPALTSLSCYAN